MGVNIERTIDAESADALSAMYRRAFEPLRTLTATKQTLDDSEFRTMLDLDQVMKFVGRTNDGTPVALSMMTPELKLIPWINPEFFIERYPEHHATGRLFYIPTLLVHPDHQRGHWFVGLVKEMSLVAGAVHGVAIMDCCRYNDEELGFLDMIHSVADRHTHHSFSEVDSQRFFALCPDGLRDRRDRRAPEDA